MEGKLNKKKKVRNTPLAGGNNSQPRVMDEVIFKCTNPPLTLCMVTEHFSLPCTKKCRDVGLSKKRNS